MRRLLVCLLLAIELAISPQLTDVARASTQTKDQQQAPAGGLLELPPTDLLKKHWVSNPGFENGSADWKLGPCWSIDQQTAHQGSRSLRFDKSGTCFSAPAETLVPSDRETSRSWTLRGWVKESAGSDLRVRLAVHDQNDRSYILGGTDSVRPGSDWQLLEKRNIDLLPVHDKHVLQVWAVAEGTNGTAWFDDVEFVEEGPPPLSAFLLYPNFRGFLWSDGPQTIRLQVNLAVADFSKVKLRALLMTSSGTPVKTVEQSAKDSQVLELDGSKLSLGSYRLHPELVDAHTGRSLAAYPVYAIAKVSDEFRRGLVNYIAPDNFLVHKGKKRFVWGVYDRFSARFRCRDCLFTQATDYEQIRGFGGLHTIENYADTLSNVEINILPFAGVKVNPPDDQLSPWLEALDRHGVGHLQIMGNWVEGNRARPLWARNLTDQQLWNLVITAMKGRAGAIGYYTYDEPTPDKIPAVFSQYLALRRNDPGSVAYGVLANVKQVFRWRDISDVVGCDPYPLGFSPNADDIAYGATSVPVMLRTSVATRETEQQVYGSRPIWMVLQLFRFNGRFPSYQEMKMQAYKAIINGATGILWWGFVSEKGIEAEWYKMDNYRSYLDFKRLSQEIMGLESVLMSPKRAELVRSVSDPNIEFTAKAVTGRVMIFASNFSETPARNVTINLARTTSVSSSTAEVYSEGRTLPVAQIGKNTGASVIDSFGPYEVHVYVFKSE